MITRRSFLRYCGGGAAALGLDSSRLGLLADVLAGTDAPSVLWLKGSSCDGCSISFLNRISDSAPHTVAEVLTESINLIWHLNLSSLCGESAVAAMQRAYERGNYILVIEGGVPTAFDGHACVAWHYAGREFTFMEVVQQYTARAAHIVCVGTCAAWGGIPASGGNLTQVVGVKALTGRTTVNVAGCPANPDWIVWTLVRLLTGGTIVLDSVGRPTELYRDHGWIHDSCPRNGNGLGEATDFGQAGRCLIRLGCRGPATRARCDRCWNGKDGSGRWCIGVNAPCHGCVESTFPGPQSFFTPYDSEAAKRDLYTGQGERTCR